MLTADVSTRPPSPERIFGVMNAYQQSAALRAAIELGVFTAIGEGHDTAAAIAKKCQASERGVRILCDFLAIEQLLAKEDGKYALTPDTAFFMNEKSPAYIGGAIGFMLNPDLVGNFNRLAETIREGTCGEENASEVDHPAWVLFARHMAALMQMPSQALAARVVGEETKPLKVLDIAAGHGLFGLRILERNPQARVVAVDWPNVLGVARENVEHAGQTDRWEAKEGSAFDVDFGTGYDVVLLTNFLHHFDVPTNEKLLKKIHAALNPDGRVFTLEFVPNDDRVSPPAAAAFPLIMLANTAAGDAYTFKEYDAMFRNAGFTRNSLEELPPTFSRLVISQK